MADLGAMNGQALLLLGNQLFPEWHLEPFRDMPVFMAEDVGLCTYVRHHQQKLVLFLAAMRHHRDRLRDTGWTVAYHELTTDDDIRPYLDRLADWLRSEDIRTLHGFEVEDRFMAEALAARMESLGVAWKPRPSPMFMVSRAEFVAWLDRAGRPFMKTFYEHQRRARGIMIGHDGQPWGGRWSFDTENRKALPDGEAIPARRAVPRTARVEEVVPLVERRFSDHPGRASDFDWPVTREQALEMMHDFIEHRLDGFGPYEDALSPRDPVLFHSMLSVPLNLGLLTPDEVIAAALTRHDRRPVPLASLEGFVRQILGWREFIRGVYQRFGEEEERANAWGHHRTLAPCWWDATTGLPPVDAAIAKAIRMGWAHHIERLMVLGNVMLLCEVHPREVYRWFMEMFVDSSDWVMVPNVFGMSQFADSGIFATKPYLCGSNYLRKMGRYPKGPWCDVLDGLYWRFIGRHRDVFAGQPRLGMAVRTYDRLDPARRQKIVGEAERFIGRATLG